MLYYITSSVTIYLSDTYTITIILNINLVNVLSNDITISNNRTDYISNLIYIVKVILLNNVTSDNMS